MIKVLLAHIEPRFLRAPRLKIHNASELALAAGVSQISPSRLVRQVEAGGFLDCFADQLELVRIQDLLEEASCGRQSLQGDLLPLGYSRSWPETIRIRAQARQLRQASREIPGNGNSPRVCLGLFAAAEPELITTARNF
jgi:hypothetical protein